MKKTSYNLYIFILLILTASCRDYVEIEPEGNSRILKYTSDYRALMNNYLELESVGGMSIIASDDIEFSTEYQANVSDVWKNIYTWNNFIYEEGATEIDWSNLYKAIYNTNVVIDGVMDSKEGVDDEKREIYSEAKVHRAFAYLHLVNEYAVHYNSSTASSDKGVPLLLTPDLFSSLERASVEKVYAQIIADVTDVIDGLPDLPNFNVLPSKASAYGILARTYLYMGNYDMALKYAGDALELKSSLLDLNDYASSPYFYPPKLDNSEIIFSKIAPSTYARAPLNQELLDLIEDEDIRYDVYTIDGANLYPAFEGRAYSMNTISYTNGINIGISVPEMMLIKAECLARNNEADTAMGVINTLRAKRFPSTSDYELTASDSEQALSLVLKERRIELLGRGFRWADQKRLNLESRFAETETREFEGKTFTLEANSDNYAFPVFQDYIDLNPEMGK